MPAAGTALGVSFNSLLEAADYFKDEEVARRYLHRHRWDGCPVCPHCKSDKVCCFSDCKRFKCKVCKKQFTATVGTIFESSKIPLRKWFIAIYLVLEHKKGISSHQLGKDIRVTQKTAWFMLHRIRETLREKDPEVLAGMVMSDETFVGGKNRFRHKDKKVKYKEDREFKDKTPVLGFMREDGYVRLIVVKDVTKETIIPLVLDHVEPGSTLVTDDWRSYRKLDKDYHHEVVKHGNGQYMNEFGYTTNRLEGFWTTLKRSVIGIYHKVSRKYLQKYCYEFAHRYNFRGLSVFEKFTQVMQGCGDVRLLYKNLVSS